ncbi:MAG: hypothetical protein R8L53_02610, partial [Mariprofundales bacterium]
MFFKVLWSACRCTLLLIALIISLIVAWAFWNIPDAASFQDEMQRVLQYELQLGKLEVSPLYWQWSLQPSLMAKKLSFSSLDGRINMQDAILHARISLTGLLFGRLTPADVHIEAGHLYVKLDDPKNTNSSLNTSSSDDAVTVAKTGLPLLASLPPFRLHVLHTDIDWEYAGMYGQLRQVNVDMNADIRRLSIASSAIDAYVIWDDKQEMQMLRLNLHNAALLPDKWQDFIQLRKLDSLAGELQAIKRKNNSWNTNLSLWTTDGSQAKIKVIDQYSKKTTELLAFQRIETNAILSVDPNNGSLADIYCTTLHYENNYKNKKYQVDGKLHWDGQILHASVSRGVFPLYPVWNWLRPIDDTNEWHTWLAAMKSGFGKNITGYLHLPWSNLQQTPDVKAWQAAKFMVNANVYAADIALDDVGTLLTDVSGKLHLDTYSLYAKIDKAILPDGVGTLHQGILAIDNWNTLPLDISGKAEVDLERLRRWLKIPRTNKKLILHKAPVKGDFSLLWMADEVMPRSGSAVLHPQGRWQATIDGQALHLSDGRLLWEHNKHVLIEDMYANTSLISAVVNVRAIPDLDGEKDHGASGEAWEIASINLQAKGDFTTLAQKFQLPLRNPKGIWHANIQGDEQHWLATIDATDASWQRLLGSEKQAGIDYKLNASIDNDNDNEKTEWRISSIMQPLRLSAIGRQKNNGNHHIKINDVYSQGFIGDLAIELPVQTNKANKANKALNIKLYAKYLGDSMLPDGPQNNINTQSANVKKQAWEIIGKVEQLHYGRLLAK